MLSLEEKAFVEDCPASPLPHMLLNQENNVMEPSEHGLEATLYLTTACNLRCITCYVSAGAPLRNELSVEEWLRIIEKLSDLGTRYVYLLGGEPTLLGKDKLSKLIKASREYGMVTGMSTNGYFINEEMAKAIRKAGINQVQLSIDGASASVNDAIRGKGSFEAAIRAANVLKKEGINFSTSMVITSTNYFQSLEFVKMSESLGASAATLIVAQPFGNATNKIIPTRSEVQEAYDLLKYYKPKIKLILNGFRFYLKDFFQIGLKLDRTLNKSKKDASVCQAGKSRFVINSNGDVYGCELLMEPAFKEGNALKDILNDIWNNGFSAFRRRNSSKIYGCDSCPFSKICNSGCPARAYRFYGSFNHKDPLCPISTYK